MAEVVTIADQIVAARNNKDQLFQIYNTFDIPLLSKYNLDDDPRKRKLFWVEERKKLGVIDVNVRIAQFIVREYLSLISIVEIHDLYAHDRDSDENYRWVTQVISDLFTGIPVEGRRVGPIFVRFYMLYVTYMLLKDGVRFHENINGKRLKNDLKTKEDNKYVDIALTTGSVMEEILFRVNFCRYSYLFVNIEAQLCVAFQVYLKFYVEDDPSSLSIDETLRAYCKEVCDGFFSTTHDVFYRDDRFIEYGTLPPAVFGMHQDTGDVFVQSPYLYRGGIVKGTRYRVDYESAFKSLGFSRFGHFDSKENPAFLVDPGEIRKAYLKPYDQITVLDDSRVDLVIDPRNFILPGQTQDVGPSAPSAPQEPSHVNQASPPVDPTELVGRISQTKQEIEATKSSIDNTKALINTRVPSMRKKRGSTQPGVLKVDSLENELSTLNSELAALKAQDELLKKDEIILNSAVNDLNAKLQQKRIELDQGKGQLTQQEKVIAGINKQIETLNGQIKEVSEQITKGTNILAKSSKQSVGVVQKALTAKQAELAALNVKLSVIKGKIDSSTEPVNQEAKIQEQIEKVDAEIAQVTAKLKDETTKEQQLDAKLKEKEGLTTTESEKRVSLNKFKKQLDSQLKRNTTKEEKLKIATSDLETRKRENEAIEQQIASLQVKYKNVMGDVFKYTDNKDVQGEEDDDAMDEENTPKSGGEQAPIDLNISGIKNKLQEAERQKTSFENELKEFNEALDILEKIKAKQKKNEDLRKSLEQLKKENPVVPGDTKTLEVLKAESDVLDSEYKQIKNELNGKPVKQKLKDKNEEKEKAIKLLKEARDKKKAKGKDGGDPSSSSSSSSDDDSSDGGDDDGYSSSSSCSSSGVGKYMGLEDKDRQTFASEVLRPLSHVEQLIGLPSSEFKLQQGPRGVTYEGPTLFGEDVKILDELRILQEMIGQPVAASSVAPPPAAPFRIPIHPPPKLGENGAKPVASPEMYGNFPDENSYHHYLSFVYGNVSPFTTEDKEYENVLRMVQDDRFSSVNTVDELRSYLRLKYDMCSEGTRHDLNIAPRLSRTSGRMKRGKEDTEIVTVYEHLQSISQLLSRIQGDGKEGDADDETTEVSLTGLARRVNEVLEDNRLLMHEFHSSRVEQVFTSRAIYPKLYEDGRMDEVHPGNFYVAKRFGMIADKVRAYKVHLDEVQPGLFDKLMNYIAPHDRGIHVKQQLEDVIPLLHDVLQALWETFLKRHKTYVLEGILSIIGTGPAVNLLDRTDIAREFNQFRNDEAVHALLESRGYYHEYTQIQGKPNFDIPDACRLVQIILDSAFDYRARYENAKTTWLPKVAIADEFGEMKNNVIKHTIDDMLRKYTDDFKRSSDELKRIADEFTKSNDKLPDQLESKINAIKVENTDLSKKFADAVSNERKEVTAAIKDAVSRWEKAFAYWEAALKSVSNTSKVTLETLKDIKGLVRAFEAFGNSLYTKWSKEAVTLTARLISNGTKLQPSGGDTIHEPVPGGDDHSHMALLAEAFTQIKKGEVKYCNQCIGEEPRDLVERHHAAKMALKAKRDTGLLLLEPIPPLVMYLCARHRRQVQDIESPVVIIGGLPDKKWLYIYTGFHP